MPEVTADLLGDVEEYLNITWKDEKTDKKITGYINRGMARLQFIAGAPLDFTKEDLPRSLLLDYCRYANSQALEVFGTNFQGELLELNLMSQIASICTLTVISLPGAIDGNTAITVSPVLTSGNSYMVRTDITILLPAQADICDISAGYTVWDGAAEISATTGNEIVIIEVDSALKAVKVGKATIAAKG